MTRHGCRRHDGSPGRWCVRSLAGASAGDLQQQVLSAERTVQLHRPPALTQTVKVQGGESVLVRQAGRGCLRIGVVARSQGAGGTARPRRRVLRPVTPGPEGVPRLVTEGKPGGRASDGSVFRADHPGVLLQGVDDRVQQVGRGGILAVDLVMEGAQGIDGGAQPHGDKVDNGAHTQLALRERGEWWLLPRCWSGRPGRS